MSKRAEEKALEAYPPIQMNCDGEVVSPGYDKHTRIIYCKAYEQAEKETIERAVAWLEEHWVKFPNPDVPTEIVVKQFKQAMEEQK